MELQRFVVTAYCDAADLDGSDPMIWLKLACAARIMGQIQWNVRQCMFSNEGESVRTSMNVEDNNMFVLRLCEAKEDVVENLLGLRYSQLERYYALERGMTLLRPGIKPNRCISSKAYVEFEKSCNSNPPYKGNSTPGEGHEEASLCLNLPRYSWATLGRLLIRASREALGPRAPQQESKKFVDQVPQPWTVQASWHESDYSFHSKVFGSPAVKLRISPILTLPHEALGTICEYLSGVGGGRSGSGDDLKRLEATCRSLSGILMSARVAIENGRSVRAKLIEQELAKNMLEKVHPSADSLIHGVTLDDIGTLISPTKGNLAGKQQESANRDELKSE